MDMRSNLKTLHKYNQDDSEDVARSNALFSYGNNNNNGRNGSF